MNEAEKKLAEEAEKKAKEANDKRNAERLDKINAIADSNEDEMVKRGDLKAEELEREKPEDIVEPEPREEPDDETVRAEAEARALQQEGAADEKDINGVRHYLTIVNGREKWQTLRELRENAQKVESADEYLRQASEAVTTASRRVPSTDEQASLGKDEVRKLLAAAALGDEEATDKLAAAIARPSLNPDVLQALDQRMSFRTELAALEAEQSDLLEDKWMGRLFRSRLNEMREQSPNTGLSEAYRSIGKELREAFPGFKRSTAEAKLERKRTLSQVPTAAKRQTTEPEDDGEEDPTIVIEKMARDRGLTAHLHRRQ